MEKSLRQRNIARDRRTLRVRKKVRGTSIKPRMSVCKSNSYLYVQLIDDENGITLSGLGTISKQCPAKVRSKESARWLGEQIARMAKEKNIEKVVFDRGKYKYHGLIAEIADGARQAGLQF